MTQKEALRELMIEVPRAGAVSALLVEPKNPGGWLFVYAPGAGSNLHDPFGAFASRALTQAGVAVLRFQFPYQERKKSGPDPNPVLEAAWSSALEQAEGLADGRRVVAGGRSMGGRIASQVVAAGSRVRALALFAYPLHPPGHPEKARDSHLADIPVPALFCGGTRDAFASPDELRTAAEKVLHSSVHLLEGADHGFSVLKSSGRTREDVWREACDALVDFLSTA